MNFKSLFLILGCVSAGMLYSALPAKPLATPPLNKSLTGWQTWPSTGERTFPDSQLPEGRTNAVVDVVSAKNAAATATFAIRTSAAVGSLTLKVEDIPLQQIDIRTVKCWYQNANGWFSAWKAPGNAVLVPELLLHDDSLVKTDPAAKANLLRTSPEGSPAEYVTVDPIKTATADFIVADDAATLKPFSLAAGETREFFIKMTIPEDAATGLFKGKIIVSDGDKPLGNFILNLRVIDYTLPEASSRFLGSKHLDGTKVISGAAPAPVEANRYEPFIAAAELPEAMASKAACRDLLTTDNITAVIPPALIPEAKAVKSGSAARIVVADAFSTAGDLSAIKSQIKSGADALRKSGFTDILYYIPSEKADAAFRDVLDAAESAGVRTLVFADEETYASSADLISAPMQKGLIPENVGKAPTLMGGPYGNNEYTDTRQIERWHALGTPNYLFVTVDAGIENPGLWRRKLGLECYYLGFDGFILPRITENQNAWTDSSSEMMRSRTFLYPTKSGAVSTLAYEAIGEAITDARYLSAVTRLADEARYYEGDIKVGIEGRKASSWLDCLWPKRENIETTRLNAIAWVDRLATILNQIGK